MSDTVVVMDKGVIQQIGTPEDIYNEPQNAFVADFIGESNIVPAVMLDDYKVRMKGMLFPCVDSGFGKNVEVDAVVRPEDIDIVPPEKARVAGTVASVVFMGVHYDTRLIADDGTEFIIHTTKKTTSGSRIGIVIGPDDIHIMERSIYDGPTTV